MRKSKQFQRQYLIKWRGYSSSQNTWENEENIFDLSLIQNYFDEMPINEREKAFLILTNELVRNF